MPFITTHTDSTSGAGSAPSGIALPDIPIDAPAEQEKRALERVSSMGVLRSRGLDASDGGAIIHVALPVATANVDGKSCTPSPSKAGPRRSSRLRLKQELRLSTPHTVLPPSDGDCSSGLSDALHGVHTQGIQTTLRDVGPSVPPTRVAHTPPPSHPPSPDAGSRLGIVRRKRESMDDPDQSMSLGQQKRRKLSSPVTFTIPPPPFTVPRPPRRSSKRKAPQADPNDRPLKRVRFSEPIASASVSPLPGPSTSPAPQPFRLLDLPVELALEVMHQMDYTEAVSVFIRSCRGLHDALAHPYLLRERILNQLPHSVDVRLSATSTRLEASFLGCLSPLEGSVWVDIDFYTLVAFRKELRPFFRNQKIFDLRIRLDTERTFPPDIESPICYLYSFLRSMGPGLAGLSLANVREDGGLPVASRQPSPTPSDDERYLGVWDLKSLCSRLSSLSVSMEWLELQYFPSLWAALSKAPRLLSITARGISTQEECDSVLSPLRSDILQDVYLLSNSSTLITLNPLFLSENHTLEHLTSMASPRAFDLLQAVAPLDLPPVPDIHITCNFPFISTMDASSLRCLTLLPVCKYKSPWSKDYCDHFRFYMGALRSLSGLGDTMRNVQLHIEFPWRLSTHLSQGVTGCTCVETGRGFKIEGVQLLYLLSDDDYSPSTLKFLFDLLDAFCDLEGFHCNAKATAFEKSGGSDRVPSVMRKHRRLGCFTTFEHRWRYSGEQIVRETKIAPGLSV